MPQTLPALLRVLGALAPLCVTCASGLEAEEPLQFSDLSQLLDGPGTEDPVDRPRHDYGPLWGDFDGDGWIDLVFMNHGDFPSLYRNHYGSRLVDRFDASGLQKDGWRYPQQKDRHGAACADFDNDGDLDLFITHGAKRGDTLGVKSDELLANKGDGTFADISGAAGAENNLGRARTPTWLDYDSDGHLDLLIGNVRSPNVLLRNQGDGTFVDVTSALGVGTEGSAHPAWADIDGDGDPDLLSVWPVEHLRNQEGRAFEPVQPFPTGQPGVPSGLAVTWGDFDEDSRIDVLITSSLAGESRLLRNGGGTLTPWPIEFGLHPKEGGSGAAAGDLDNDGDLDLVVLGRRQVRFLVNQGGGAFTSQSLDAPQLKPRYEGDVALADLDRDGLLDLAISASDGQHLYRNDQSGGGWLELHLRGGRSNAQGLGALVTISAPGHADLHRQNLGDSGFYKSVSCAPLHVGTGPRAAVSLEVHWPSGTIQRIDGLPTSRSVVLAESRR